MPMVSGRSTTRARTSGTRVLPAVRTTNVLFTCARNRAAPASSTRNGAQGPPTKAPPMDVNNEDTSAVRPSRAPTQTFRKPARDTFTNQFSGR